MKNNLENSTKKLHYMEIINNGIRKNIEKSLLDVNVNLSILSIADWLVDDRNKNEGYNRVDVSRLSGALKFEFYQNAKLDLDIKICDKVATDIIINITKYDEEHK